MNPGSFVLFDLGLTSLSTIFQSYSDGEPWICSLTDALLIALPSPVKFLFSCCCSYVHVLGHIDLPNAFILTIAFASSRMDGIANMLYKAPFTYGRI